MKTLRSIIALSLLAAGILSCAHQATADLVLVNARVYTLAWPEPDPEGRPAAGAPHDTSGWRPDADAIAIAGTRVVFVGRQSDAPKLARAGRSVDLKGATVIPGLVDSHVHLANLGAALERVNLVGAATEGDAVGRVVERAASVSKGEWIVGWGWDEGAWTSHLPDMRLQIGRASCRERVL